MPSRRKIKRLRKRGCTHLVKRVKSAREMKSLVRHGWTLAAIEKNTVWGSAICTGSIWTLTKAL